ncbi:MAG: DUF3429 domain-containing protein [Phyllobacteriaceae bacterium]|nr:DUF3429 domain-containing protein [Phyllobacteriaceae bacterium]
MIDTQLKARRLVALGLTAAGALPFLAAAALVVLFGGSYDGWIAEEVATLYGAVILSFLGGVRWGVALSRGPVAALPLSVIPSLAAFFSLFMTVRAALLVLMAGFVAQMIWDALSGDVLPEWFIRLRLAITITVLLCLAVTLYGVF